MFRSLQHVQFKFNFFDRSGIWDSIPYLCSPRDFRERMDSQDVLLGKTTSLTQDLHPHRNYSHYNVVLERNTVWYIPLDGETASVV